MPKKRAKTPWPQVRLRADGTDDEPRFLTLTVLSMAELRHRLEAIGDRVAASLNRLPHTDRPLLAFQISAESAPVPKLRDVDGEDFHFIQGGLAWRPSSMRLDEPADVYVLTQALQYPRWAPAAGYEIPPVTLKHPVFYIVLLPSQIGPGQPLEALVGREGESVEVPIDLVALPPHPLLWWGTPPARAG